MLENGLYDGPLYRALNPVYARQPLSGQGAARYGGRFNPKGVETLYAALDPSTAIREANQVGSLQPTVLVSYKGPVGPVFDGRDGVALARFGMSETGQADPAWRARMLNGEAVPTQDFATRLMQSGFAALLVPSFAKGAGGLNMVLWKWPDLSVIDDENRLERM